MSEYNKNLNGAAYFFLAVTVFFEIMDIANSAMEMRVNSLLGMSNAALMESITFSALIIVAAVLIFMKKSYGLIAFIVLLVLRVFATIPRNTDIAYSYYQGTGVRDSPGCS